eukprot:UN07914
MIWKRNYISLILSMGHIATVAFDIANHFNEYAGFECDYNLYPDKDVQYHFFRNYLSDRPSEVQEQDLDALYTETNTFRLASHLYWALWALIQARVSPIDFDYLGYFFLRYGEYKKQREFCFSLAQGSFFPEEWLVLRT